MNAMKTERQEGKLRQGNVRLVAADAERLLPAYLRGKLSISGIMRAYHVGYEPMRRWLRTVTTEAQRREADRLCRRRLAKATGFQKGSVPWCKGLRMPGHGKADTWFRKGQIRGNAARRYRGVGTIVVRDETKPRKCGGRRATAGKRKLRRWIKVSDIGPSQKRYLEYARYLWQQLHGPIPPGGRIVHVDGNTMNDSPGNLMLTDMAGNLRHMMARQPEAVAKVRRNRSAATRKWWRQYRARQQAGPSASAIAAGDRLAWECHGCGEGYSAPPPAQCPKCGGGGFDRTG